MLPKPTCKLAAQTPDHRTLRVAVWRWLLLVCLWPHGCSGRRRARPPARLGALTSFGAAPRSRPVPSGPSGALHTCGAWCADVWLGASARCPARPRHRPPAPRPGRLDRPVPSTPVARGVLMGCSARRLVVRPVPAGLAAASNRAVLIVCVLPARPCRRPPAPRPGPGLLYVAQLWLSIINFACNSPESISSIEI